MAYDAKSLHGREFLFGNRQFGGIETSRPCKSQRPNCGEVMLHPMFGNCRRKGRDRQCREFGEEPLGMPTTRMLARANATDLPSVQVYMAKETTSISRGLAMSTNSLCAHKKSALSNGTATEAIINSHPS